MSTEKITHPDFAERMQQACDGNPDVPPPNYGRLGWFVKQLDERCGLNVTVETVRKWFAGESRPRPKMIAGLSLVLGVDEAWLSLGQQPEISDKVVRKHTLANGGAVNVVAGFIQLHGGHPAFPTEGDKRAEDDKVDLYAIIKGAQYAFHIAVAGPKGFIVPTAAEKTVVIGFELKENFDFNLVELDWERVTEVGRRIGGAYTVPLEGDWKKIENFKERL
ncbi:helix-turn-helix domain-containing protein [Celeribacter halophilus]|uniref:helix-turn-helix domain-containing protein n=1 Tax=Celeribacter halophilus TaxID=576117 RepID=UPI001C09A44F|nr:helix-turn-helix transcriptional regulator [Celeribacter halophilus]MBU2890980.1 helix-turn-helix domain-containing protein [Celeribacter halophilus]MDO6511134.1 helix-turn-helix transcriptional regulator [Celeribacter halophilus]